MPEGDVVGLVCEGDDALGVVLGDGEEVLEDAGRPVDGGRQGIDTLKP